MIIQMHTEELYRPILGYNKVNTLLTYCITGLPKLIHLRNQDFMLHGIACT